MKKIKNRFYKNNKFRIINLFHKKIKEFSGIVIISDKNNKLVELIDLFSAKPIYIPISNSDPIFHSLEANKKYLVEFKRIIFLKNSYFFVFHPIVKETFLTPDKVKSALNEMRTDL